MSPPRDPHDGTLPAWPPTPLPPTVARPPIPALDEDDDASAGPRKPFSAKLAWRAFRRHWWQALIFWAAGSAALMALAYSKIKPTYAAIARVRVEPSERGLFTGGGGPNGEDFLAFKETQVQSVTSPVVLGSALAAHQHLLNTPRLRGAEDPEAEIRAAVQVAIVPKTNLIQVSMTSPTPEEASAIVNAVVDAYLESSKAHSSEEIEQRIRQLKADRDNRVRELASRRAELQRLSEKIGASSTDSVRDRNRLTLDGYRQLNEQLTRTEIDVITTEGKLQQLVAERDAPAQGPAPEQINLAVSDAFYSDPRIASLQAQIAQGQSKLETLRNINRRKPLDPSMKVQEVRVRTLQEDLRRAWTQMEPRLRQRIRTEGTGRSLDDSIRETRVLLASMQKQAETLEERLGRMKVESKNANSDSLLLEFAHNDVDRAEAMRNVVENQLNDLEHTAKSPLARVRLEFSARKSDKPSAQHRTKVMAAVPFLVFGLAIVLCMLAEVRAGRVADPDELPGRLRLQVLGVVPPLPTLRPAGLLPGRVEMRAQRQLDEFVQSLDHLRVALCARPDPWGRDRHCVLITSACGSEGKTTLAAQLAERCVNAGLMTLLIDGDLRNPTLSRMLDADEAPGLINVLRDELPAEDAMVVVGDAGGFHFLPAGTPRLDPSRILQGDALGRLIARARESFDMILVDAPPVLPVPDALTIGRWTDGAVLAVRYDTSRFVQVERANRRLAHVGVPVLGAVVNGVRANESSYGGYYAYGGPAAGGGHGLES